jgi:osmotically-inducible protein OsmY
MKNRTLTTIFAATLAVGGISTLACSTSHRTAAGKPETTSQYVDSSVITTKVKAAILEDPMLKSFQIGVETMKDVVQLSGFVDSPAAVHRAGEVASGVKGVASVKNDLLVK